MVVSVMLTRPNGTDTNFVFSGGWGTVRSSCSTQEEEEVQAWDRRPPRDQKISTEHGPSHPKAPVFTTRTRFLTRNDKDLRICAITCGRFVGSRSCTGHDDASERLHGSRFAVAKFGHPRSSRSGGSLPGPSVRRRVSPPHENRVKLYRV